MRNRADEDARLVHMSLQMDGEAPSSLRKDLEHLMILVSSFWVFWEKNKKTEEKKKLKLILVSFIHLSS